MRHKYEVGQSFEVITPFILEDKEIQDTEKEFGLKTIKSWRPGVRHEHIYPDDARPVWDGEGYEIRKVVYVAIIAGVGTRVLYRRSWSRPDGKMFGKTTIRMTTAAAFTAWRNGSSSGMRKEFMDWRERDRRDTTRDVDGVAYSDWLIERTKEHEGVLDLV